MNKKILAIALTAVLLCGAATVLASHAIEQYEINSYEENTKFEIQPLSSTKTNRISQMAAYIKTIETNLSYIDDLIFNYAYIVQIYNPTEDEMNYIDELIYSGANVSDIIDIYKFWMTTNKDINMIGQIYDLKTEVNDEYWIEEAFNKITQNVHGVLNKEEVSEYLKQGLKLMDIDMANKLSRKGIYTINEILDMKISNKTWDYIVSSIENNGEKTAAVNDANIMQSALELSEKTNVDVSNYIKNDTAVNMIDKEEINVNTEINQEIYSILAELGVLIDELSADADNAALSQDVKSIVLNNGISETELNSLLDEGYMLIDVLNASEVYKSNGTPIRQTLENGGVF